MFFVIATAQQQDVKRENSVKVRKFLWSHEKLTSASRRKNQVLPVQCYFNVVRNYQNLQMNSLIQNNLNTMQ